jgi:cell division topological specificity factor
MTRLIARTPVGSAPVARERLQTLLEHDRCLVSHADLLSVLREEIYALVGRHAAIDPNKVHVMVARGSTASTMTVDIEVPFRVPTTATRFMHDGEGKGVLPYW